jgi:hypothetical protein
MTTNFGSSIAQCCLPSNACPDTFGCPPGVCPDFEIKRYDTNPPFILSVTDCNGPLDLTDCVVEVSMWAKARLKTDITTSTTTLAFADSVGFEQLLTGDVIVMSRKRSPETMLVTGFDEVNKFVNVQRGYNGSTVNSYTKGSHLSVFRVLNSLGDVNMVRQNIEQIDGTIKNDILVDSQLLYNWRPQDTCLPGCYWLEWKLLKIQRNLITPTAIVDSLIVEVLGKANAISLIFPTVAQPQCQLSGEVEWIRRFPVGSGGYLIHIVDTPNI